jgi:hypothetical protein
MKPGPCAEAAVHRARTTWLVSQPGYSRHLPAIHSLRLQAAGQNGLRRIWYCNASLCNRSARYSGVARAAYAGRHVPASTIRMLQAHTSHMLTAGGACRWLTVGEPLIGRERQKDVTGWRDPGACLAVAAAPGA